MSKEQCEECGGFGAQERGGRVLCKHCWLGDQRNHWELTRWTDIFECRHCRRSFQPKFGFETYCPECWMAKKRIEGRVKLWQEIEELKREEEWKREEEEGG